MQIMIFAVSIDFNFIIWGKKQNTHYLTLILWAASAMRSNFSNNSLKERKSISYVLLKHLPLGFSRDKVSSRIALRVVDNSLVPITYRIDQSKSFKNISDIAATDSERLNTSSCPLIWYTFTSSVATTGGTSASSSLNFLADKPRAIAPHTIYSMASSILLRLFPTTKRGNTVVSTTLGLTILSQLVWIRFEIISLSLQFAIMEHVATASLYLSLCGTREAILVRRRPGDRLCNRRDQWFRRKNDCGRPVMPATDARQKRRRRREEERKKTTLHTLYLIVEYKKKKDFFRYNNDDWLIVDIDVLLDSM